MCSTMRYGHFPCVEITKHPLLLYCRMTVQQLSCGSMDIAKLTGAMKGGVRRYEQNSCEIILHIVLQKFIDNVCTI